MQKLPFFKQQIEAQTLKFELNPNKFLVSKEGSLNQDDFR